MFSAGADDGVAMQKTARLVARVTELAVTDGDAYDVWPSPGCDPAVYNCYHSQPAGTTDFGQCGTYRQVLRCTYASACEVSPPAVLDHRRRHLVPGAHARGVERGVHPLVLV
ncbi:hypothetical protein F0U60_47290 [Archangium minus]|uniref:Lipoprotein n=1 Tax=Archangium minus TaxID=83450 RepID=A0ABY9X683_9BACT|nr:hypothetical protein F0U60_47290 [Archangium minus]